MSRPRRAATQKKKKIEDELDLSDEDSDDGDFSSGNSDDDFKPNQSENGKDETFEESDESDSEEISDQESPESTNSRGTKNKNFKTTTNLQDLLNKAKFQKKKSIFDDIKNDREKTPEFDCSGGFNLSDSDDDGQPTTSSKAIKAVKKKSNLTENIISSSSKSMADLKAVYENYQREQEDNAKMLKYKNSSNTRNESVNVADLLAMGEGGLNKSSQKRARSSQHASDSDSDDGWEEVEEKTYKTPIEGVEIVLNSDFKQEHITKKVKEVDLEAQFKRKINRQRKENQIHLHKASLVAWVAHGNFVNRSINNSRLMAIALELLPKNKNQCYPKEKTDLAYFQQITSWFKSTIAISNRNMYCNFKPRPPTVTSLALQMKFKKAISRRDHVLIFAVLLRAIGIQCRVVQSLVMAPIVPPKSELLSLSKKPESKTNGKSSNSKPNIKSSSSNKSRDKVSSSSSSKSRKSYETSKSKSSGKSTSSRSSRSKADNKLKEPIIPQLDGGDDRTAAKSNARKSVKLKIAESADKIDNRKIQNPLSPVVKHPLDSPNRIQSSPSEKLFKSSKKTANSGTKASVSKLGEIEALPAFSPRKTRSKGRDVPVSTTLKNSNASKAKTVSKISKVETKVEAENITPPGKTTNAKNNIAGDKDSRTSGKQKDTLQVFSPRRLRSRSRSQDPKEAVSERTESKKPNLVNLQENPRKRTKSSGNEVESKKIRLSKSNKRFSENHGDGIAKKPKIIEDDDDSDGSAKLFKPNKSSKKASNSSDSKLPTSKSVDRRVLSSDSDEESPATVSPSKQSKGIDIWVEVYSEKDERWISIDVFKNKVDCISEIIKSATRQMVYVFAWNNDNSVKDISARYCPNLNTTIRKMRVEPKYLDSVINQFAGPKTSRDRKEDDELNMLQLAKPMPTSIAEFKNHPLYALSRHLLKYEAIYPPEPPILGYIRDEAIYPRDCVFILHTRETWLKEAKVVKLNEQPYKITKTLKWDKATNKILKDIPQELFGPWQTKDYEPPVAENGLVPRNAYGNVELFKPQMLPIGCVHLQLPGLNKVCKKLGVDCSQAIVGFDSNGGWPFPVYDGYIICEEFQEKVLDAWNREQEEQEVKQREKYEKRVYGNWKKLIKGLLIRERLKNKYNFDS